MFVQGPPLIGLMGRKRSGKDFTAAILGQRLGFRRFAFADAVRDFVLACDPLIGDRTASKPLRVSDVVDAFGWETAKAHPEVRRTLQVYGMAARELDADFWIRPVLMEAARLRDEGHAVVITDVRFVNEVSAIVNDFGRLGFVSRPEVDALPLDEADAHPSEAMAVSGLGRTFADYLIINTAGGRGVAEFVGQVSADYLGRLA